MSSTSEHAPIGAAIVGCGDIAGRYVDSLAAHPQVRLVGAFDLDAERASALAATFDGEAYPSYEALLADERVGIVVNLTAPKAHVPVIRQALAAGKHVHTEKPLALTGDDARSLVAAAAAAGLRLSSSPITFLGEAQQLVGKLVREGALGTVRLVYAETNGGRLERFHPAPAAFYEIGPVWDIGVYPIAALTSWFGPVRRLTAWTRTLHPERTHEGAPLRVQAPDLAIVVLEHENGTVARLTSNFYVDETSKQGFMELHGDDASIFLESPTFDAPVQLAQHGEPYAPVELPVAPAEGIDWGLGVAELASAIQQDRPQRAGGEHPAHIVEVVEAIMRAPDGTPVEIASSFPAPAPVDWAAAAAAGGA